MVIGSKTPVPCHNPDDQSEKGCGVFSLKVTVTESNPSKAPQLLENAATEVSKPSTADYQLHNYGKIVRENGATQEVRLDTFLRRILASKRPL
jgi:hypothetical protein